VLIQLWDGQVSVVAQEIGSDRALPLVNLSQKCLIHFGFWILDLPVSLKDYTMRGHSFRVWKNGVQGWNPWLGAQPLLRDTQFEQGIRHKD